MFIGLILAYFSVSLKTNESTDSIGKLFKILVECSFLGCPVITMKTAVDLHGIADPILFSHGIEA